MGQQVDPEFCHLWIVALHDLLANGVDHHAAPGRVCHEEVAGLSVVVCRHLVKMALEHDSELGGEDLIVALLRCNVHHLHELRCWMLLDLKDKEAD